MLGAGQRQDFVKMTTTEQQNLTARATFNAPTRNRSGMLAKSGSIPT
jgi:hypothetical protein